MDVPFRFLSTATLPYTSAVLHWNWVTSILLAIAVPTAFAQGLSGFVSGEVRLFPNDPAFPEQSGRSVWPSLAFQPEYRTEWGQGNDRLTLVPFLRLDATDSERTHGDIRELNWLHIGSDWDLRLGLGKVFWGVAESRHLVDVINQTDFVENIDEEDKLGQPMINLSLLRDWGTVGLFVLPGFRERTFPGVEGRLRPSLPVDTDNPEFESAAEQWHVDLAARWSHVIGDWDIGLAHFWGTGREPRLLPEFNTFGIPDRLIPHYDIVNQTSLDLQVTKGSWLWKLEALTRSGQGDRFGAVVGGFEYTLFGISDSGADLGLLAEYLYDGRDAAPAAPLVAFQNDVFVGMRLALNDVHDSTLLVSSTIDVENGTTFSNVEGSRRLGNRWVVALEARFFTNVSDEDALRFFRKDDYIQIELARYF